MEGRPPCRPVSAKRNHLTQNGPDGAGPSTLFLPVRSKTRFAVGNERLTFVEGKVIKEIV
jgi:hypothetical protein